MASDRHTNYFVHTLLRARDWQHRPQLDAVCDWWRGGGRGVCALVGMGGAGKTAVAERFLRMLPGGLPVDPQVAKDRSLPTPHSTFVFSFYDAANPEAFFEALQMWLEHTPRVQTILSVSQMMFLLQQTPGLIVLDGLERVQHDGQRGDFGRLASPALRDFLNHLAAGNVPELSVLVTSRFPLADLRDKHPQFFRTIAVDQIEVHAGVELLRQRGVRGTDPQLAPIVHQCGRHALTVDFAGGYIAEYGQGDPATPLDLGTAEQLQAAAREELDEDRQEVLRQGYRFARIAEHYRDAMLDKDEAAMALLERICLFRLGVDALALAAIFTGEQAVEVSGQALAALNAEQLQSKLDWLVRMRIVEATDTSPTRERGNEGSRAATASLARRASVESRILYAIHPAVRDGFLSGIGRDVALAGHEAVRKGLEVSLGEAPGENPSDPATLDLLEEIVHHTLQSGHVREAWDIYRNRIGGFKNLGWRLGAYERGERICRAFAGGQSPESCLSLRESSTESDATFAERKATNAPWRELPEAKQATFINEWALYLHQLGRLAAAARCYELYIETRMRQEDWKNASAGNQNLCDVWLLSGRLSRSLPLGVEPAGADHARLGESSDGALATADEALRLAELAADAFQSCMSYAYRGDARALRGDVPAALAEFRAALEWQHKHEHDTERPLYSNRGYWHTHLLARLGRREEATRLAKRAKEIQEENWGPTDFHIPKYQLVLSSLSVARSGSSSSAARSSADLWTKARDWGLARDAKEVLCWSYLVETQHELVKIKRTQTEGNKANKEDNDFVSLAAFCSKTLASGLKIARDCGFGLYHIDLLLERARLHLLRGDARAALDDIEVALGDSSGGGGIPANEETGQVELLAANHEACGYAWAIPVGLQLRAEALLLQAAREVISVGWALPTEEGKLLPINVEAVGNAHPTIRQLIADAKQLLHEALDRWHDLRDPEPTEDNNFQLDGKEYNYRAAETWQILQDLDRGTLTKYPLQKTIEIESKLVPVQSHEPSTMSNRFHVALSFPGEHRAFVLQVADALAAKLNKDRVFYDEWYEAELLGSGGDLKLQAMYEQADLVVPFFSEYYDKPWCSMEWETIRGILLTRRKEDAVIPVHLDETDIPGWSAVNFGIRLKGRSPQQIAEVILEALVKRIASLERRRPP